MNDTTRVGVSNSNELNNTSVEIRGSSSMFNTLIYGDPKLRAYSIEDKEQK